MQAFKALHAPFDPAAIVRTCDHFLARVATLGEGDRIDAVEVEHLRHEQCRSGCVDLRWPCACRVRAIAGESCGPSGLARLRDADQHRAIIAQRPAFRECQPRALRPGANSGVLALISLITSFERSRYLRSWEATGSSSSRGSIARISLSARAASQSRATVRPADCAAPRAGWFRTRAAQDRLTMTLQEFTSIRALEAQHAEVFQPASGRGSRRGVVVGLRRFWHTCDYAGSDDDPLDSGISTASAATALLRAPEPRAAPREVGGPPLPEPTRYGDWEVRAAVSTSEQE